jgi:protein gp37
MAGQRRGAVVPRQVQEAALVPLEEARRLLAEFKTVPEVKDLRDIAAAAQHYARQRDLGLETMNDAAEIKLRAERKLGELLSGMPKHNGDPRSHDVTRLADLGINKMDSHRWQRVAGVPEKAFEAHVAGVRQAKGELTTAGVLDVAKRLKAGGDSPDTHEPEGGRFVPLEDWNALPARERRRLLNPEGGDSRFNPQGDNENIEWALWSWNPVTGCEHNCPYCYARDIANRVYPQGFAPSLWPERLLAPRNTPFPAEKAAGWMGHKNVFVCSMVDLFGRWVPAEWIGAVLREVRAAGQWNFLFLTKFPIRMAEFDFPDNAWVGTTVDCLARVANAEKAFRKVKAGVKWLSCEPLIEPLKFKDLGAFDWVVLGGASASTRTPEWHPPRAWVKAIEDEATRLGVRVYEKANLFERVRQYPGVDVWEPLAQAPEALRYLPLPMAD